MKKLVLLMLCMAVSSPVLAAPKGKAPKKVTPIENSESPSYASEEPSYSSYGSGRTSRAQIGLELLGAGLLYSFNGSYLITDNFAVGAGIGYFNITGTSTLGTTEVSIGALVVPLTASYLIGGPDHHFELFGGLTPLFASGEVRRNNSVTDRATGSGSFFNLGFAYRYWPADGGFHFRPAFYFMFLPDKVQPWIGLQFGYAF